ncbi:MAG: 50S ribosomal protein L21 [Snowella sp.]|nr:50S ribosomal protein L21 [Snowella sp.]
MSYAIIEAGGTQLRVEPGRFYDLNRLAADLDEGYVIDKVLLVNDDNQITVGQPFVEGATVEGKILAHRRGRKVIVYKMRPKKKTRKKRGHRQELTRLLITSISINGTAIASVSEEELKKPVLSNAPATLEEE